MSEKGTKEKRNSEKDKLLAELKDAKEQAYNALRQKELSEQLCAQAIQNVNEIETKLASLESNHD